ncbi:MAG: hypothetical protein J6R99_03680 [Alphaproteobacteria bacterium]|nr:hypothetical protein [Alphaproteobacteria bacterium]
MCVKSWFVGLFAVFVSLAASAVELRGVTSVNVTSDTAANAKNMAFDEARRQIIFDSLRQYADEDALGALVKSAKTANLANLIAESGIDGEQVSDTTYSANITMRIDAEAARQWLDVNEIRNWLPDVNEEDVFVVVVNMSNKLDNWAQLYQIAKAQNIDLGTQFISGNMARLELPVSVRGNFTIAVRSAGWKYADKDGELHIWK